MKVIPLQKYVLLEVVEYAEGNFGIQLPPSARKKIPKGKVLAKGDYVDEEINVGDIVIYDKSGSKALPLNNEVLVPDYRIHLTENV